MVRISENGQAWKKDLSPCIDQPFCKAIHQQHYHAQPHEKYFSKNPAVLILAIKFNTFYFKLCYFYVYFNVFLMHTQIRTNE